ncbi:MAG: type II toxin-antitoxin system VapC family toxin [Chloroflexota bacterium]|nr:type II toxin-antitoxin system VapC family toxin [Chloroflexota bacterium]
MTFLLDTNVVSELRKSDRVVDQSVRAWARAQRTGELWLSVISVMEIEVGVARLERRDPMRGKALRDWLERDVLGGFSGRILSVDLHVARRAAALHVPDPRPERDTLIAATALQHNLVVVTRNVADFSAAGVALVNPWHPA